MQHEARQALIERYLAAFAQDDIPAMLATLHPDFIYERLSGDTLTHRCRGKSDFAALSRETGPAGRGRHPVITDLRFEAHQATAGIRLYEDPPGSNVIARPEKCIFSFADGLISQLREIT